MENVSNHRTTSPNSNGAGKYKVHNAQAVRQIKSDWALGKKYLEAATADKRGLRRRGTVADLRATGNNKNGSLRSNGSATRGSLSSTPSVLGPRTTIARSPTRLSLPLQAAKAASGAASQGAQSRQVREELPARRSGQVPRLSYVKPDHHQMVHPDPLATKAASLHTPRSILKTHCGGWSESQEKPDDSAPKPPAKEGSAKLTASDQNPGTDHWNTLKSPRGPCHSVGQAPTLGPPRNASDERIHGLDLGLNNLADITKPLRLSYYANPRQIWWRPSVSAEAPPPEHVEIVTEWLGLTPSIATMLFSIHNAFIGCLQNILSPQLRTLSNDARGDRKDAAAGPQRTLRFNRIELSTAMLDQLMLEGVLSDTDISMPRLVNLYLATVNHIDGSGQENEQEASITLRVKKSEVTTSQHRYVEALPTPDFLIFNQFNASPREGEEIVLQPSYRCTSPYRTSEAPATVIYKASAPWLQWDGAAGCFKGVVHGVARYPPGLCDNASGKPNHGSYPLRVSIEATYVCHGPVAPVWVERTIRAQVQFNFRPWQPTVEPLISGRAANSTLGSCLGLNQPYLSEPDIYLKHVLDTLLSSTSNLAHNQTTRPKEAIDEQQQSAVPAKEYQRLLDTSSAVSLLGEKHGYVAERLSALAQEHAEAKACCMEFCRAIDALSASQRRTTNPDDDDAVLQCTKARADTLSSTPPASVALKESHRLEKAALNGQRDGSADETCQIPVKYGLENVGNHRRSKKHPFVVRHHHVSQGSKASSTETNAGDKGQSVQIICHDKLALLSDSGCELSSKYEDDDSKHGSTGKQNYESDTTMDDSQSDLNWSAYSSCDPDPLLGASSTATSSTAEDRSRTKRETIYSHRRAAEIDGLTALCIPKTLQLSNDSSQDDSSDKERMSPDEKLDLHHAIRDSIEEQTARKMAGIGLPEYMDDIFDSESSTKGEDTETDTDADSTTGSQDEEA